VGQLLVAALTQTEPLTTPETTPETTPGIAPEEPAAQ
jgi:hypothetical protein